MDIVILLFIMRFQLTKTIFIYIKIVNKLLDVNAILMAIIVLVTSRWNVETLVSNECFLTFEPLLQVSILAYKKK